MDRGYDRSGCVSELRHLQGTPHVAQRTVGSAIDARGARHPPATVSQRMRKRAEQIFGWMNTVGGTARPDFEEYGAWNGDSLWR